MKKSLIWIPAFAIAALAQTTGAGQTPPAPDLSAIKTYLGLTDSQVTALQAIQQQRRTAISSVQQQIQQKQTSLKTLISGGSTDAAAVGRLVLDIAALRKQIDPTTTNLVAQATAVLTTADQKAKLKTLSDASQLQVQIREAEFLLLLAPPSPPQGGPGDFFGPRMFGGPRRPGQMGPNRMGPAPAWLALPQ